LTTIHYNGGDRDLNVEIEHGYQWDKFKFYVRLDIIEKVLPAQQLVYYQLLLN
jgi:hypothetical protein